MGKNSEIRLANGVVSAVIVVFFIAHGTLGALSQVTGESNPVPWLVWVGVALIGVHVALCVVTSRQQLSDAQHPPSQRKKRHLALKWVTGAALASAATAHVVAVKLMGAPSANADVAGSLAIIAVAVFLAVHLCVGSKSLLKDIGVDRRYKLGFRIVVCAFAAVFVISAIVGMVG